MNFLDEQQRRRRQTWRASIACALAALVTGAPLAVLLTPAVFLAVGLVLRFLPGAGPILKALLEAGQRVPRAFEAAADAGTWSSVLSAPVIFGTVFVLGPGMLALFLLWLVLRARFARVGVGGLLASLPVRPPRADDVEEFQLVNTVQEMALAAGCRAPEVLLLDGEPPNAAAIGSGLADARVVVSRSVLDSLDRDETQAVVGHLIGSVANGDLRILESLDALFQSSGLALLTLDAFVGMSPSAFRDLMRVLRFWLSRSSDPAQAAEIEKLLVANPGEIRRDGLSELTDDLGREHPQTRLGRVIKRLPPLYVVLVPFLLLYLVSLFLRWQNYLLRAVLVGPMVMLVWRSRRYLADAAAVQLTRNPDALLRALSRLSTEGSVLSRAVWCEPLFVVGAEAGGSAKGSWTDELGGFVGSHPSLARRHRRIVAMGGHEAGPVAPRRKWTTRQITLLTLAGSLLAAVMTPLVLFVIGMSFLLAAVPSLFVTLVALSLVLTLLS